MKIVKSVSSVLVLTMLVTGSMFGGGNGKGKTVSREQVYPPVPAALRTPYALANSYSPVSSSSSSSGSSSTTKSASSTSSAIAHAASSRDRDIEMQDVAIKLDSKFAAEDKTGCWGRYKQACSDAIKRNWSKLSPGTQKIIKLSGLTTVSMILLVRQVFGDEFPRVAALGLAGLAARITKSDNYFGQMLGGAAAAGLFVALNYYAGTNLWVSLLASELYPVCCTLDKIVELVEPKSETAQVQTGPDMV